MDVITFASTGKGVAISINGVAFLDLAAESVRKLGKKQVREARGYLPLTWAVVPSPKHWYGETDLVFSADYENDRAGEDDQDPIIFGCTCGIVGCSPLTVHIDVDARRVRWSNVRHWMNWDSSRLGPWVFDRHQYDAEVNELTKALRAISQW